MPEEAAVSNPIVDALASSSAHGISRAASTQSTPKRVVWILLFLIFLGLFCFSAVTVVNKLMNVSIVRTVEVDAVHFQFPDLYLCPSNTISGSYPFTLNKTEAAMVNDEVERLGKIHDQIYPKYGDWLPYKAAMIIRSLSSQVRKLLFQRPEQSGHPVKPIFDEEQNKTFTLPQWDSALQGEIPANGYCLLLVPEGHYPSTYFEDVVMLAPGRSYEISVSMEEIAYSAELQGRNCSTSEPIMSFVDPLSGGKVEYNYSYSACVFSKANHDRHRATNQTFVDGYYPVPWELRHTPRWGNLSDMLNITESALHYSSIDPKIHCKPLGPCVYRKYKVDSFSFQSWPLYSDKFSDIFEELKRGKQLPALEKLARIAEKLDAGAASAHTEADLRNFVQYSMLKLNIRPESRHSPKVVIAYSYSWIAFLAEIGGLLGLYIGCSMLTVCELIELLYHLVMCAAISWSGRVKRDGDQELQVGTAESAGGDVTGEMLEKI